MIHLGNIGKNKSRRQGYLKPLRERINRFPKGLKEECGPPNTHVSPDQTYRFQNQKMAIPCDLEPLTSQ